MGKETDGKVMYSIQLAHLKALWELIQINLETRR